MSIKTRTYGLRVVACLLLLACTRGESSPPFDPHIKDLDLVRLVTGDEARKSIDKLHGMPIDVVQGFIAEYNGPYGKATIWVSEATSEDLAKEQTEVMIEKMESSKRSPFSHFRARDAKGLRITAFDGLGQEHCVFRDKTWVYWVSADERSMDMIVEHIHTQ
jgi:hypothetical protein